MRRDSHLARNETMGGNLLLSGTVLWKSGLSNKAIVRELLYTKPVKYLETTVQ